MIIASAGQHLKLPILFLPTNAKQNWEAIMSITFCKVVKVITLYAGTVDGYSIELDTLHFSIAADILEDMLFAFNRERFSQTAWLDFTDAKDLARKYSLGNHAIRNKAADALRKVAAYC